MRIIFIALTFVIFGALFMPLMAAVDGNGADVLEDSVKKSAPPFELTDLSGKVYRLSSYAGSKPVIVWFTNFCEGCQAAIPRLNSVYEKEIRPQAEFLAISLLGSDTKTAQEISKKLKLEFPVLIDSDGTVCKDFVGEYVTASCPAQNLFLIDMVGTIRYEGRYPGRGVAEAMSVLKRLIDRKGND